MTPEIEALIRKIMAKDIHIAMERREMEGFIISKEIVLEILRELTEEIKTNEQTRTN